MSLDLSIEAGVLPYLTKCDRPLPRTSVRIYNASPDHICIQLRMRLPYGRSKVIADHLASLNVTQDEARQIGNALITAAVGKRSETA